MDKLKELISKLQSQHANKIYLAKEYTKQNLIDELEDIFNLLEKRLDDLVDYVGELESKLYYD